ncbi:transketolase C-terminal domain-containing protein [Streptomyces sp. CSDS2]|uniref:transketolase family protein n=1 Tax=Streptomyces sp. CSDS2 TaxID=3055051 RepID=UPI0025B0AB1B|nr:transketolase C-terminal domain-containing protein [Streptomyces sp. CSDS2]MDN3264943.1 transketolase C-terminal domain-containing protein [Streptomyces sp. CSDS2]
MTGPVTAPADPQPAEAPVPSSREVYRDLLVEFLNADERVVCLDSDTGLFNGVDFGKGAERYVNLGIAEQNLMGAAAGLARSGRTPYVNTMATFATTRALEQLKLDIALNDLPVRIAATHGGLSAGHLGATHHALEDLAVTRLLPNLTVLVPTDAATTAELLRQAQELPGPVYIRLGRNATPDLPYDAPPVELGKAQRLREGDALTLVATGPYPVHLALEAASALDAAGVATTVLNLHTIKPLDTEALVAAARTSRAVVTVEEHWVSGGLGSAVAETIAELGLPVPVRRIGVGDRFAAGTGGQTHLLERNGITAEAIVAAATEALGR